jgi:hypothetical protein
MKKSLIITSVALLTLNLVGCGGNTITEKGDKGDKGDNGDNGLSSYEIYCKYHPAYKGSEEDWINALASGELAKSYSTTYNIIYTLATIPPVLAALDSIDNGNETYAMIERGKTYYGISKIENFHNIGFNESSNQSDGFTQELFDKVVNTIEDLNVYGNEKFNIYVQDGTALNALQLAANASLTNSQYNIIMIEDGTGAYQALKQNYIDGKNVSSSNDEVYNYYCQEVNDVKNEVNSILSSNDNKISTYPYDIKKAWALASLDNFTYWLQDESQVKDIIEKANSTDNTKSKLLSVLGFEEYADKVEYHFDSKYASINDYVSNFSDTQKQQYLTLMYGNYYQDTYNALTRTSLEDGTSVPSKKLVFIGSRIKGSPDLLTLLGIGKATKKEEIPDDYASLDNKYKNELIFNSEEDYKIFIDTVNNSNSYLETMTESQKDSIRVDAFNYYVNYIMSMKYTYIQYGTTYDIIVKGHPSEVLGEYSKWTNHYVSNDYTYDKLMNDVCLKFHTSDSIGKYIGMVPYGTAAENLAYLGADISLCGLNSSTYTGYDTSVDVLFVLEIANGDITKNTNLNSRYEANNLTYHVGEEEYVTKYDNSGNIYKNVANIYSKLGNTELYNKYMEMFNNWLKETYSFDNTSSYDINPQGILISK